MDTWSSFSKGKGIALGPLEKEKNGSLPRLLLQKQDARGRKKKAKSQEESRMNCLGMQNLTRWWKTHPPGCPWSPPGISPETQGSEPGGRGARKGFLLWCLALLSWMCSLQLSGQHLRSCCHVQPRKYNRGMFMQLQFIYRCLELQSQWWI